MEHAANAGGNDSLNSVLSVAAAAMTLASLFQLGVQGVALAGDGRLYSALWGRDGERWEPGGRLPDFSYAGYRMGEVPIPDVPVKVNVKALGAKGDGQTDDTNAFKEAIRRVSNGAVLVPPGRYVITDILEITRSGLVLRGAGPEKTTLFFPKYLNDIKPNWGATTGGRRTSNYSWGGGYVQIRSSFGRRRLAKVVERARRGERLIVVDKPPGVRVGDFVDLRQRDREDNSLARYLYDGQSDDVSQLKGRTRTSFVSRVVGVQGNRIRIERALRTDIDPAWSAEVYEFRPGVTDCGVEELTFEFPNVPYKGHFTELGYNPIAISGAAHCWVRNIRIVNADSGPMVAGRFCTLRGITYESEREPDRRGSVGHHGIILSGDENLFEGFDFRAKFIHDITVSHCAAGNVCRRGRGVDLCFDHHKYASHANLFTDIDLGEGRRMYRCGGGANLGRHSAAWETFWNLRARSPQRPPPKRFGPDLMNFVGVVTRDKAVTEPDGRWWEPIPPMLLYPPDLYEAQLKRRLRGPGDSRAEGASRPRRRSASEPSARPEVSGEVLATWDAKLKARTRTALEAGGRVRLRPSQRAPEANVRSMDGDGRLHLSGGGLEATLAWDGLSIDERRSLAASLARGGAREDVALAAFYCLALGRPARAEEYLVKLPTALATEVREAFK